MKIEQIDSAYNRQQQTSKSCHMFNKKKLIFYLNYTHSRSPSFTDNPGLRSVVEKNTNTTSLKCTFYVNDEIILLHLYQLKKLLSLSAWDQHTTGKCHIFDVLFVMN